MEIIRVPHTVPQTEVTVSLANTEYEYQITDLADLSVRTGSGFSDANSVLTVDFPTRYDGSYELLVDNQDLVFDVVRPYVDPTSNGNTATEIAAYKKNEEIARAIIDSIIEEGFYFKKKVVHRVGMGSDYIPLWDDAKKLLKLYENNVLIFDAENPDLYDPKYTISADKTAITLDYSGEVNLSEQRPTRLPSSSSDLMDLTYGYHGFPEGFDYSILLEVGYSQVPSDIVRAAELLIDDISCGRMEYFMRHVTEYNTDQFKMKFASQAFEGTGNIIVDKILSKYYKSIRHMGVL